MSVVIPAFNAADTLGETLDSLLAQTLRNWEAIVVDDGSTDESGRIAESYAAKDARIRVVHQAQADKSAARNRGVEDTSADWLIFLDADDWLEPGGLELLYTAVCRDGSLDAIHGRWVRVPADGSVMPPEQCADLIDLFPLFADYCAFPMHSCLVRRERAAAAPFDVTLRTCEDWDFWQRVARAGARFARVNDRVARYRMRPGSAATDTDRLLRDGLGVIARGHRPDPRVASPNHPHGAPANELADANTHFAAWVAGLVIGRRGDPTTCLEAIDGQASPWVSPYAIAHNLFRTVPLASARGLGAWDELWPAVSPAIGEFLDGLEQRSGAWRLRRRVERALEHLTIGVSTQPRPFTRGRTLAVTIDVSHPLTDIEVSNGEDRVDGEVRYGGRMIGNVTFPVASANVPSERIADTIAADYSWQLVLERFQTVDEVGWTLFLQETWGRPDWPSSAFYDPSHPDRQNAPSTKTNDVLSVEVSDPMPGIVSGAPAVTVRVLVGGALLGTLSVAPVDGTITVQRLRAAITEAAGFDLCRAVVRQALVGLPTADPTPIRARLATKAAAARLDSANSVFPTRGRLVVSEWRALAQRIVAEMGAAPNALPADLALPPSSGASAPALGAPNATPFDRHHFETVFSRGRDPWSYETPYERLKYEQTMAVIPGGQISHALELACAEGRFTRLLAPRVDSLLATDISQVALDRAAVVCDGLSNVTFAQLDLIGDDLGGPYDLIVCSEVLYYAGSIDALKSIAGKLANGLVDGGLLVLTHTHVARDDANEAGLDWDVPFGAKVIGETFARVPNLHFARELRTELYRVQLFQRSQAKSVQRPVPDRAIPHRLTLAPHYPPVPHVAARFRRGGLSVQARGSSSDVRSTSQLPILMYHRVAPNGSPATSRYRVTPEVFEAQLQYLQKSGFYTVTPDEWRVALHFRRPLPGRAVMLTFDDGYQDFATHAWPQLYRYGYSATVFLVTDFVGGSNDWDVASGESLPLLGWDAILDLARQGVTFGSHSASHRPMTGLDNADVVREAIRSRALLERRLGQAVTTLAYPHGEQDAVVQELVAGCGYSLAFSCRPGRSSLRDNPWALARIEVSSYDDLTTFIAKLGD